MEKPIEPKNTLTAAQCQVAQRTIDIMRQYLDGAITWQEALNKMTSACGFTQC